MNKFINLLLILIIACSCKLKLQGNKNVSEILIRYHSPVRKGIRECHVYFIDNFSIYKIPLIHTRQVSGIIENEDSVRKNPDITCRYFLRKGKDQYGYRFEGLTSVEGTKLNADSFLAVQGGVNFYSQDISARIKKDYSLYKEFANNPVEFTRIYLGNNQQDAADTLTLKFSKNVAWNKIPFSFSEEEDSAKTRKLIKVNYGFIFNPESSDMLRNKRIEIFYEMN